MVLSVPFINFVQAKAAAMKMKFMAVNASDGENVEEAILKLLADTMAYQKTHCNDPVDPWATPTPSDTQPVVSCANQYHGV